MGRGSEPASQAATSAQSLSGTYSGNAGSLFSTLAPILSSEAAHPAGMSPTDIANADTASMQGAGGSQGAAVGTGLLRAARTRNAGGADAATGASSRAAGEQLSNDGLKTRLANFALKRQQQSEGVRGMEGLFGENLTGGNQALGQVAADVNADTNAENASWDWAKDLFVPLVQAAGSAARPPGGCWIAEAIYGPDDPRTHTVRAWLNGPFRETRAGDLTMRVYLAIGRQVAWVARRSAILRRVLRPLFEMALARAKGVNA